MFSQRLPLLRTVPVIAQIMYGAVLIQSTIDASRLLLCTGNLQPSDANRFFQDKI